MEQLVAYGCALSLAGCAAAAAAPLARRIGARIAWPVPRSAGSPPIPGRVPLLGGGALLFGLLCGWAAAALAGLAIGRAWLAWSGMLGGYAAIGLIDDVRDLAPQTRLLCELSIAAGACWIAARLTAAAPATAADGAALALAAIAITAGANAFNWIDNSDGLAAGVGALTMLGFALLPLPPAARAAAWAAAGALIGFLAWNRPPARLYMGDFGALPIGALLGLLLLTALPARGIGVTTGPIRGAGGILLLLGYLLLDPVYALLGRWRAGRAPWIGGRDHPAHHLAALRGRWRPVWLAILLAQAISVSTGLGLLRAAWPLWTAVPALLLWWLLLAGAARGGAR
jgi:UDP-N-acetylmuramyl pentapeptide phosphotransferase/UDP-N-acetylglucosamine-1-phosphate transferase